MKPSKISIRVGLVFLIIVTVVLAVRAVFNSTEGRKLTLTLAEFKEKGMPISAKDLAAPCPDADNAARLWKAAENLLLADKDEKELLGRALLDVVAAKPMDPTNRAALTGLVAKNERALQLLYEMAGKPCFLLRDPGAQLPLATFPNAVKMILAGRLLGFDALLRAEEGDLESAIIKIRLGLEFGPMFAREGTLITHLVAVADARLLTYFLAAICRDKRIKDDALLQLIAGLDPGPWRGRLAYSIAGERALGLERGSGLIQGKFEGMAEETKTNRLLYWLLRPVIKSEIRRRLKEYDGWEQIAAEPYFRQRASLKTFEESLGRVPWYFKLTGYWEGAGNIAAFFLKNAMLEATFLASRTGLACRLYKSRTGAYPKNLEALVPGILSEVPVDPFTGKPLVYRREGEGFIVYSLGSNEKDDGGRGTWSITQAVMDKDDDWTWRESR